MQKTPQRTFQRGAEQANMNYGGFSSYNTPRGVANTFTTLDGKVFSVYNGHIIFTPEMAEAIYPKLDLNKVRFTVENEAFCSNGQNSGPAQ